MMRALPNKHYTVEHGYKSSGYHEATEKDGDQGRIPRRDL